MIDVPSLTEIPLIVKILANKQTFNAIIALTYDNEHQAQIHDELIRSCMQISLTENTPIILTCVNQMNIEQSDNVVIKAVDNSIFIANVIKTLELI